ncbi:MAG: nitrous oxide reductase accessory protein NosL [Desulfobacteraceae bacterium]|nr:nitrous oxide reductase accessory protein NosL [Desulfobacteraceae bacterium]
MRLIGTILAFFLLTSVAPAQDISPGKPTREDKCPVCGMFVAKFPDFEAQIVFKNGGRVFFDGAKDLFKYALDVKKYQPEKSADDIAAIYVTDYYSLNPVDAGKAFYVLGSNVYGPMGKELIPFEKESDAKEFMTDHGGKAVLTFTAVSAGTLEGLD